MGHESTKTWNIQLSMWLAILVTVVASAGNNVGKALQKEATRHLPRFSIDPKILLQYARSRQWLIGLGTDLGGALLMIAAFALAPVSWKLYCFLATVEVSLCMLSLTTIAPNQSSGGMRGLHRCHWCSQCQAWAWQYFRSFLIFT